TAFGARLQKELNADTYYLSYKDSSDRLSQLLDSVRIKKYNKLIVGIHNYALRPANNYGISQTAMALWDSLQRNTTATFVFGNVYATQNFYNSNTLVAMHQDDDITQNAAADFVEGKLASSGTLPVTIGGNSYGSGIAINRFIPTGTSPAWLVIDSIVNDALAKKAFPGCEVLAVHDGEIKYHKAFGKYEFD